MAVTIRSSRNGITCTKALPTSSSVTASQARRFRRFRPCESMSSSRPMMTETVWVTLTSVPGTKAWNLVRCEE